MREPRLVHPDHKTILRCIQHLRECGNVTFDRRNAGAPMHIHVDQEEEILQAFDENPGDSVRRVARRLGVSRYVVHRTLRQNGLHLYHYQRVQQLLPRDYEQRIYFCEGTFIIIHVFTLIFYKF